MSGINQMEYFQSIVDEFTGTEFTTEDLMDKTLSSKEEIPCDVWLSKDKFSIIHVEEYPELSEEELELLSEIKGKYGFISEEQSPPHFMDALKIHRKNIVQWHDSLFPKPVIIEDIDKEDLATIIKVLGEEKDGRIIANEIDKYRNKKPIKTSQELASIINNAKKNYNKYKKNPATKTFQAIRIFVNQELTELILGLIGAVKLLSNEGILIVVSFHSLEDKIVKNFFNLYSNLRKNPSRYLPINETKSSLFKLVSKKSLKPDAKEIKENIRSRSAKLRYAIRNNNSFFYPSEFKNKFANYFKLEGGRI